MTDTIQPMYTLKPVEDPSSVFFYNSSMYKIKNVDPNVPASFKTGSINSNDDVYSEVERSQTVIFDYIASIKKQIHELRQILLKRSGGKSSDNTKSNNRIANEMRDDTSVRDRGITHEVVVNCDVNCPPYSLLVLHRLSKELSLQITSHHHSSLKAHHNDIIEKFTKIKTSNMNGGHNLYLRLIWKNTGGTSVVLGHVPLTGEVSLLRFVHACLKSGFSASEETRLQELFDQLNNCGPSSFESVINGKGNIIGNKLSVIDIALWSALKHSKASGKLDQWYRHFDSILSN